MKIIPERGDLILYTVASDGQGNKVWEYGKVQAVINELVYLGSGLVVAVDNVLPCAEDMRGVMDQINTAHCAGAKVYGYKKEEKVA